MGRLTGFVLEGRYALGASLGRGGSAAVYEAQDLRTGRAVAVKLLANAAAVSDAARHRLEREVLAAAQLEHDVLVPVLDLSLEAHTEPAPFVVFELLRGRDLRDELLESGVLPVPRGVWVALKLASALAAAHAAGVVHRDLKPENVFLQRQQTLPLRVRLLDFGMAKLREPDGSLGAPALTGEGELIGSPLYMAPEQAAGADADARADVYALAVVLFEMLTGELPYAESGELERLEALPLAERLLAQLDIVRNGAARRLADVVLDAPAELDDLVAAALERDPARRMSMATFFRAIDRAHGRL